MTPEERAEKALPDVLLEHLPKGWVISLRNEIVKAICEAGEEGYKRGLMDAAQMQRDTEILMAIGKPQADRKSYFEGRASMREDAAKIVEEQIDSNSSSAMFKPIADRIRAIPLEGK